MHNLDESARIRLYGAKYAKIAKRARWEETSQAFESRYLFCTHTIMWQGAFAAALTPAGRETLIHLVRGRIPSPNTTKPGLPTPAPYR